MQQATRSSRKALLKANVFPLKLKGGVFTALVGLQFGIDQHPQHIAPECIFNLNEGQFVH